jgi:hypothetical protein
LLAQVITLLSPEGLQLPDDRFALVNEGDGIFGDLTPESLFDVKAELLKLPL